MACTKKRKKKSENVVFCWLSKRILLILLSSCGRLLTKKKKKTSHSQPKLVFFSCRARCQVSLQSPDRYFPLGEVTSTLSAQRHRQVRLRVSLIAPPCFVCRAAGAELFRGLWLPSSARWEGGQTSEQNATVEVSQHILYFSPALQISITAWKA